MKKILVVLLVLSGGKWINAQNLPFTCDGTLYMSHSSSPAATELYEIFLDSIFTIEILGGTTVRYNGIAYNTGDNFIYGMHPETFRAYRIGQGGTVNDLGVVQNMPAGKFWAGDFLSDGRYVVTGGHNTDYIVTINTDLFPPVADTSILKYYADGSPGIPGFGDIAIDPFDGQCYGYDTQNRQFAWIDLLSGAVTCFGPVHADIPNFGSLNFDAFGRLYGYSGGILFEIDKLSGSLNELTSGPLFTYSIDGCSCPKYVDLALDILPGSICPGDTAILFLRISNSTGQGMEELDFLLELPSGLTFPGNPSPLPGGLLSGGAGSSFLRIEGMEAAPGLTQFSVPVFAKPVPGPGKTFALQAVMTGFPSFLPDTLLSDDTSSVRLDDASLLELRPLPGFELGPDTVICPSTAIRLATGLDGMDHRWQDGSNEASFLAEDPGLYSVEVDAGGCLMYDSIRIAVKDSCIAACRFTFPNAFTPNGDGLNDVFRGIPNCRLSDYRLSIYNRWGQRVFFSTDIHAAWDGRFMGKEQPLGTYIWQCEYLITNDFNQPQQALQEGALHLIR